MMIIPNKKDAIHKAWLYRIVESIADDSYLVSVLYFKGGTCASMLSWLDRFSVDLDFDYVGEIKDIDKIRIELQKLFSNHGLVVKDQSKNGIQYFLKYENDGRNTIKIDVAFPVFTKSKYAPQRFVEIDRILICQTRDTMFAHKLVALLDRWEKTKHIAGRDIYDIHYFFLKGYDYDPLVIQERTGMQPIEFFKKLVVFIEIEVTDQVIHEDLNSLLPLEKFNTLRKVLKREVLTLIKDEIKRLN